MPSKRSPTISELKKRISSLRKKKALYMKAFNKAIKDIKKAKTAKSLSAAKKRARTARKHLIALQKKHHVLFNRIVRKIKASKGKASYKKYSRSKTGRYLKKKNDL